MDTTIIHIDKAGLADLITFHEAEIEIIDGCYFDEGRNHKTNNVIEQLYELRLTLTQQYKSRTGC